MGMDLYRLKDSAYFRWNIFEWKAVLELALRNGWQPMGTRKPSGPPVPMPEWDGNYVQNVYQVVVDQDAMAMATALEKGLLGMPGPEALVDKTANPESCVNMNSALFRTGRIDNAIRQLSKICPVIVGDSFTLDTWDTLNCFEKLAALKPKLKNFIAYLRGGAFEIH